MGHQNCSCMMASPEQKFLIIDDHNNCVGSFVYHTLGTPEQYVELLQSRDIEIGNLKDRLAESEHRRDNQRKSIVSLQQERDSLDREKMEDKERLSRQCGTINSLREQVDELDKQNHDRHDQIANQVTSILRLQSELSAVQSKIVVLENALENAPVKELERREKYYREYAEALNRKITAATDILHKGSV